MPTAFWRKTVSGMSATKSWVGRSRHNQTEIPYEDYAPFTLRDCHHHIAA